MSIKIEVPLSMRSITMGKQEIEASGQTIRELINDINHQYPGFQDRICDDSGRIHKFIAVFVDGNDIRTLQKDQTKLNGNEKISIINAIAGG